jgi:hypothetical protein
MVDRNWGGFLQTANVISGNVSLHVKSMIYHFRQVFIYQKSSLAFLTIKFADCMQFVKLLAGVKELLIKFLDTENLEPTKQLVECGSGDTSTLLMNASICQVP